MKSFFEDFLMGTLFIVALVMMVCALLVGVLGVAAAISGQISLKEAALALLICSGMGGFAVATAKNTDWI